MPPREANFPFADHFLSLDYDNSVIGQQIIPGGVTQAPPPLAENFSDSMDVEDTPDPVGAHISEMMINPIQPAANTLEEENEDDYFSVVSSGANSEDSDVAAAFDEPNQPEHNVSSISHYSLSDPLSTSVLVTDPLVGNEHENIDTSHVDPLAIDRTLSEENESINISNDNLGIDLNHQRRRRTLEKNSISSLSPPTLRRPVSIGATPSPVARNVSIGSGDIPISQSNPTHPAALSNGHIAHNLSGNDNSSPILCQVSNHDDNDLNQYTSSRPTTVSPPLIQSLHSDVLDFTSSNQPLTSQDPSQSSFMPRFLSQASQRRRRAFQEVNHNLNSVLDHDTSLDSSDDEDEGDSTIMSILRSNIGLEDGSFMLGTDQIESMRGSTHNSDIPDLNMTQDSITYGTCSNFSSAPTSPNTIIHSHEQNYHNSQGETYSNNNIIPSSMTSSRLRLISPNSEKQKYFDYKHLSHDEVEAVVVTDEEQFSPNSSSSNVFSFPPHSHVSSTIFSKGPDTAHFQTTHIGNPNSWSASIDHPLQEMSKVEQSPMVGNRSLTTHNIGNIEMSKTIPVCFQPECDNSKINSTGIINHQSYMNKNKMTFSFGPNTTVQDLKYFAERGCIVPLLQALTTPSLKTLGTRMLADYAKHSDRRVAVASNKKILEFCCNTMLEMPSPHNFHHNGGLIGMIEQQKIDKMLMGAEWPAREYAVETIRSLTATEDGDAYLMDCSGLLRALALVAKGGPFIPISENQRNSGNKIDGLVSGKARLHACIAIMNLSCGKSNKITIANIPEILEAMRDVMIAEHVHFCPATSSPKSNVSTTAEKVAEEAQLKAVTCVKNLSNSDANDEALLGTPGLIEALGVVASLTCSQGKGATICTTNACLALMNLSISKTNKHRVFKTPRVMDSLMTVIKNTSSITKGNEDKQRNSNANFEARIKACSALSNLAIGYDNKIPMFAYPGFVDSILHVIDTDNGEARTKACSILWSFAAEMKNQVPVVERGDILPMLVRVAEEDNCTEARFKCVAALTLLAESLENAIPLLESGALHPLMDILHEAGPDPTQWKGQTASWCVGFLMNIAQSDEAVPSLRESGVVELLAPLLTLDHYQSLKAAMAITFVCRYDEDDETYDLLRKTENVIPKIISLLHNTLSGRGGNGYKYGVFTLRSSVGCISSLASGPEFMKERMATDTVFESLLRVVSDFCVDGGTPGAIVGGGRDDALSATLAIRALHSLIGHLIPVSGSCALPFGTEMDKKLIIALKSFEQYQHPEVKDDTKKLASLSKVRIQSSQGYTTKDKVGKSDRSVCGKDDGTKVSENTNLIENKLVATLAEGCCVLPSLNVGDDESVDFLTTGRSQDENLTSEIVKNPTVVDVNKKCNNSNFSNNMRSHNDLSPTHTFLLTDSRSGKTYTVPIYPCGGRVFNDNRLWCYRRGRYCENGESPDPNFIWTEELHSAYSSALANNLTSIQTETSLSLEDQGIRRHYSNES